MIFTSKLFTDSTLHETRQRRQDINGWVDLSVVELTIDKDLTFCDVTCQIRYRMRDI